MADKKKRKKVWSRAKLTKILKEGRKAHNENTEAIEASFVSLENRMDEIESSITSVFTLVEEYIRLIGDIRVAAGANVVSLKDFEEASDRARAGQAPATTTGGAA